jgi:hypothetical protein
MCSACVSHGNVAVLHDFTFRWQLHVGNSLRNLLWVVGIARQKAFVIKIERQSLSDLNLTRVLYVKGQLKKENKLG